MRTPNVSPEHARLLAENARHLMTLRKAIAHSSPGTEQAVAYTEAVNALLIEKEELVEASFAKEPADA